MRSVFPRLVQAARQRGGIARSLGGVPRGADRACSARCAAAWRISSPRSRGRLPAAPCARTRAVTADRAARIGMDGDRRRRSNRRVRRHPVARPRTRRRRCCGRSTWTRRGSARPVPYVSTTSVALGWKRRDVSHPLAGSGFVVARRHNTVRITACTWVSSKWDHRAPADHVLLRAFAGGAHDPGAVDLDDRALIDMAVRDLAPLLGISAAPMLTRVYRCQERRRAAPRRPRARASQRWLGGSPPCPACSWPAAASSRSASRTVSRMAGAPAESPLITLGWDRDLREAPVVLDRDHAGSAPRSCSFRPEPSARRASPHRQPNRT